MRLRSNLKRAQAPLTCLLIFASLGSTKINCDQSVNKSSEEMTTQGATRLHQETTTLAGPTQTSTAIGSTRPPATEPQPAAPTSQAPDEYKQRPNPASTDSSAKLAYDTQHELSSTSGPEMRAQSHSNSESRGQQFATDSAPAQTSPTEAPKLATTATPSNASSSERESLVAAVDELFNGPANLNSGNDEPRAEFLVTADASAAPSEAPRASSLDDATLDLDAAATSSSLISRHGRASNNQNGAVVNTYTPPASSRLSAYSPGLLLQNSRAHPRLQEDRALQAELAEEPREPQLTPLQQHQRTIKPNTPFDPIVVCYLGSWSVYRPSLAKFTPENINPYLCTHIIYAFAGLSSKYELKPFDSYNDINQGGYRKFTGLKDYNKQLKTLIAVGGWNEGSAR